jgi:hypothetical protein
VSEATMTEISVDAPVVTVTLAVAKDITEKLRFAGVVAQQNIDVLHSLISVARAGNVHTVLGYASWTAYISDVLAEEPLVLEAVARRTFVAELTAQGMSTRAIAPIVGVDQKTVVRDIAREAFASPVHGEVASPRVVEGRDGKNYSIPASKVSFVAPSQDILNTPISQLGFGLAESKAGTTGPAEIRAALDFLMRGETRLENVGKRSGEITVWLKNESQESREQVSCIIVPPAVRTICVLSSLVNELGKLGAFHTLVEADRVRIIEALVASVVEINVALKALGVIGQNVCMESAFSPVIPG